MEQRVYSPKATAKIIGVSVATLRRWVRDRCFPRSVKMSRGRVGWFRDDIENYLEALRKAREDLVSLPSGQRPNSFNGDHKSKRRGYEN